MRGVRKPRAPRAPLRRSFGRWLAAWMSARSHGHDLADQLAVAVGVPRERVSDWVLNITLPDADECAALAAHLGVPPDEVQAARG